MTGSAAGELDLLLISPERLNNPRFRAEMLPMFAGSVGLLVIDEAHCISDWGHDFRPDYRRVKDMLSALAGDTAVLGTTATANDRVVADVVEQLAPDAVGPRHAADLPRPAGADEPAAGGRRAAAPGAAAGLAGHASRRGRSGRCRRSRARGSCTR